MASLSKPPHDRSALQPAADTLNRAVRSRFTLPERDSLKPDPLRAPSNCLNNRSFDIRTKMAVVRLLRRKWAERDEKWPETGPSAGVGGSDIWVQSPRFCAVSACVGRAIKNVSIGETGGGRGIRTLGTLARTTVFETAPFDRSGIPPHRRSACVGVVTRRPVRKGPARARRGADGAGAQHAGRRAAQRARPKRGRGSARARLCLPT
jgi:hypothetical protein